MYMWYPGKWGLEIDEEQRKREVVYPYLPYLDNAIVSIYSFVLARRHVTVILD